MTDPQQDTTRRSWGSVTLPEDAQPESKAGDDRLSRVEAEYTAMYPWADQEALRLYFRIDSVNASLRKAAKKVHASVLPGSKQWLARVLRALYMAPNRRLSHAEIGRETGVPPANVTYQVDVLRDEGYVLRVPHESDRRITFVELTAKGVEVCATIIPARTRFITDLGKVFTEGEKRTFNEFLDRLERAAIESVSSD